MFWNNPGKIKTSAVRNGCDGIKMVPSSLIGVEACAPIVNQAFQATFQLKSSWLRPLLSQLVPPLVVVERISWNDFNEAKETWRRKKMDSRYDSTVSYNKHTSEFLLSAEFSTCSSKRIQALENSSKDCNKALLVWKTRATPDRLNTCTTNSDAF